MKDLLQKINNDTLVIIGLILIAAVYAFKGNGEQVVTAIIGGFIGYMRGIDS
jgi:hypothetical protein